MLSVVREPDGVNFTRNPIPFHLAVTNGSGDLYDARGVRRRLSYSELTTQPSNADTITIVATMPDGTTMSAVVVAGTDFDTATLAGVDDTFVAGLVAALNATTLGAFVAFSYTLGLYEYVIAATVRTAEAGWSLDWSWSGGVSGVTEQSLEAYVADSTPQNYGVSIELLVQTSYDLGLWVSVWRLDDVRPNIGGVIELDLSDSLHGEIARQRDETFVPQTFSNTSVAADVQRWFMVRYSERSGSPVVADAWVDSDKYLAHMGGVDNIIWAQNYFENTFSPTFSVLSWQPDGKAIHPTQLEWIAWVNPYTSSREFRLAFQKYNQANVAGTVEAHEEGLTTKAQWQTWVIPCSPGALGFNTDDTTKKYKVWVQTWDSGIDGWVDSSQKRTYYIDRAHVPDPQMFIYLNGFGCPETLRTRGTIAKDLDVSRTLSVPLRRGATAQRGGDVRQVGYDFTQPMTFRTGYLSRAEVEQLSELFVYNECWLVRGNLADRMLILTDRVGLFDTYEVLSSLTFQAVRALRSGQFADATMAPAISVIGDPSTGDIWGNGLGAWGAGS